MRISRTLALSALGAGLALAPQAGAHDLRGGADRWGAQDGQALTVRFTAPWGGERKGHEAGACFALSYAQADADGERRANLVSYSLGGDHKGFASPLTLKVDGDGKDGGWLAPTSHKILLGVGAALLVWGIIEATGDDDSPPGPPPPM